MGIIGIGASLIKGGVKLAKGSKKAENVLNTAETVLEAREAVQDAENQSTLETVVDTVELVPVVGDVITVAKVGWSVGEASYDVATVGANASSSIQNTLLEAQGSDTRVIENQYTKTRVINDILNLNFTPETYNTKTGLRSRDNFSTIIARDENGSSIAAFQAYIDQNAQNGITINTNIENDRDPNIGTAIHPYSTPLSAAIGLGKYELAAYILKNEKTYINTQNPGWNNKTPMMILLQQPQSDKRDILINAMLDDKRLKIYYEPGKDVVDNNGFNIAMHATDNASFETMRRIIDEKGGNPKHINNHGETLIHRAVQSPDSAKKVQFLIKNGVNPNKFTNDGDSALSMALSVSCNNSHPEKQEDIDQTVKILIENADEKVIENIYTNKTNSQNMEEWLSNHPEVRDEIKKNPNHPLHKHIQNTQLSSETESQLEPTPANQPATPAPTAEATPAVQPATPTPAAEPTPPVQPATPTPTAEPTPADQPATPTPTAEPTPAVQPATPTPTAEPTPADQPASPAPTSPTKVRHYQKPAIDHSRQRLDQFKNKKISGTHLTDTNMSNALKNIESILIKQGYSPQEAQTNANVLLYKLVQANLLYHPNEKVNSSNQTVTQLFGENHRAMLANLTKDPKDFDDKTLQSYAPALSKIEETISINGHGRINTNLQRRGLQSSYSSTAHTGYEESQSTPERKPGNPQNTLAKHSQKHEENLQFNTNKRENS